MDGAVDAASAEEGGVCGVDDGGDAEGGYVGADVGDCVVEELGGGESGRCWGRVETRELVEKGEGGDLAERSYGCRHHV